MLLVLLVSCTCTLHQISAKDSGDCAETHVTPSDGSLMCVDHPGVSCESRDPETVATVSQYTRINCYCDDWCQVYGDCCDDKTATQGESTNSIAQQK